MTPIRISAFVALLTLGIAACSNEDKAQRLAVEWLEQSGEECPSPQLEIVGTKFAEPVGSVSQWMLSCSDENRYPIMITRMPRSLEQFKDKPALYEVLKDGIEDGETLADGVHVVVYGARDSFNQMYGADWPLGDFPPVADDSAND